jgi:anti-sigma factor RsiW
MKRPACTRAPQAEALEDGRLSGAERASFERHAASCAECASELRALVRLRQGAERLPASTPTPLEHRRQRQALLLRASELCQRAPVQPRRRAFAAFVLAGALVAAVCIVFGLRALRSGSEASAALAAPTYRLDASPGASWQTIEEGAALRLRLGNGSFMLEVEKLTAVQRFVVSSR